MTFAVPSTQLTGCGVLEKPHPIIRAVIAPAMIRADARVDLAACHARPERQAAMRAAFTAADRGQRDRRRGRRCAACAICSRATAPVRRRQPAQANGWVPAAAFRRAAACTAAALAACAAISARPISPRSMPEARSRAPRPRIAQRSRAIVVTERELARSAQAYGFDRPLPGARPIASAHRRPARARRG